MRAFSAELFKTGRRPAVWVCIVVLAAIAVTIGYALPWLIESHPPAGSASQLPRGTTFADLKVALYTVNVVRQTLSQWGELGGVFALIIGVLSQGSEYGWGTVKTLYTQRDGRLVMLAGKIGALAVAVLALVVVLFAADVVASTGVSLIDGQTLSYPDVAEFAKGIAALTLIYGFWALFGFVLATLFRQSAMAIGLGLAYALVIEGGQGDRRRRAAARGRHARRAGAARLRSCVHRDQCRRRATARRHDVATAAIRCTYARFARRALQTMPAIITAT